MATVNFGLARQRRKFFQRLAHHRRRALKQPAAAQSKQRVADKGDAGGVENIDDMPQRVAGRLDHARHGVADGDPVAVAHGDVERRQAMGVIGGADNFHRREALFQRLRALNVVGVMMGEEQMAQRPAARIGRRGDRCAIRRVNARRRAALRVMEQQAEIVVQTDKLDNLDRHAAPPFMRRIIIARRQNATG